MKDSPEITLISSIGTESLADLLSSVADTSLNSAIESGALQGIPFFSLLVGAMKAKRDVRDALFKRKVALFLKPISETPAHLRKRFTEEIVHSGKQHEFGQAVLLLLDKADNMEKTKIIGRLMSALILGDIDEPKTMRLCSIVNRCYVQDLELLRDFRTGTQGEQQPIAESLFSAGLLSNSGDTGGTIGGGPDEDGGIIYSLNEYGRLLVQHGL